MLAADIANRIWDLLEPHYVEFTDGDYDREREDFVALCAGSDPSDYLFLHVFAVGPRLLDRLRSRRYLYAARLACDEEGDVVLDVYRKERGTLQLMSELNRELKRLQQLVVTRPYRRRRLSPLAGRLAGS